MACATRCRSARGPGRPRHAALTLRAARRRALRGAAPRRGRGAHVKTVSQRAANMKKCEAKTSDANYCINFIYTRDACGAYCTNGDRGGPRCRPAALSPLGDRVPPPHAHTPRARPASSYAPHTLSLAALPPLWLFPLVCQHSAGVSACLRSLLTPLPRHTTGQLLSHVTVTPQSPHRTSPHIRQVGPKVSLTCVIPYSIITPHAPVRGERSIWGGPALRCAAGKSNRARCF